MTFDEGRKLLGLSTSTVMAFACRYLEERGEKFLVTFGTENAIEKATAREIERLECDEKQQD